MTISWTLELVGWGADTDFIIKLPPRSPDLTPCDFFLWRYIKSKVYVDQPNKIEELKTNIQNAFGEANHEMLNHTMRSFQERLSLVLQSKGAQPEL